ncbi:MAG: hypothetical protein R3C05_29695 [Pirellulaceae bacterium]
MYPQVAAQHLQRADSLRIFVNPPRTNPFCENVPAASGIHSAGKQRRKNGVVRHNPFVEESNVALVGSDI